MIYVFSGDGVKEFFSNEIGNHKWQRVPPTESKGRMHTSTVSVAVLDEKQDISVNIDKNDVEVIYTMGSGPGGQHRNRTMSCVILKHIPTNIQVRVDGRNQHKNESGAWKELKKRLQDKFNKEYNESYSNGRNEQIGLRSRSNRRRTYNLKTGIIVDHITNSKSSYKNIIKGKIELLH